MCSRPFDLSVLPIYVTRVPAAPLMRSLPRDLSVTLTDLTVHLKLVRFPAHSPLPIAALPSMSLFPKTTFARSHGSVETRSLPTLARCFPRSFTFYVAHPIHSIHEDGN